jgi:hypothetical protein
VFVLVALLPLVGYATWFKAVHGQFTLATSDGVFLYGRVAIFAECDQIDPPDRLQALCDTRPPSERGEVTSDYIWHDPSPVDGLPGVRTPPVFPLDRFSPERNGPAGEFARRAIIAQPLDYLRTGWRDFMRTFSWDKEVFPNSLVVSRYRFSHETWPIPDEEIVPGATALADATAYESASADTRLVQPYADWISDYQRIVTFRGPFTAAVLLTGLAGVVAGFVSARDTRWTVALLSAATSGLLVIPPFTAQFDHRYVLPAVPFAAAAAAFAVTMALQTLRGETPAGGPSGAVSLVEVSGLADACEAQQERREHDLGAGDNEHHAEEGQPHVGGGERPEIGLLPAADGDAEARDPD